MPAFHDVFRTATGNAPYAYQRALADADTLPQMSSIPTGAGKTAAVVLAWLYGFTVIVLI